MSELWVWDRGGNDGTVAGSLARPFKTIQRAIDVAPPQGCVIKVAGGVYAPIEVILLNPPDRSILPRRRHSPWLGRRGGLRESIGWRSRFLESNPEEEGGCGCISRPFGYIRRASVDGEGSCREPAQARSACEETGLMPIPRWRVGLAASQHKPETRARGAG
jgi:hypothetical protein